MPSLFMICEMDESSQNESSVPANYTEACTGPEKMLWKAAINEELSAHERNETWQVVDRPKKGHTLSARWVFTKKRNTNSHPLSNPPS